MFPLQTDTPFSREQVIAVTRAMLRIAHVDGAGTVEEVSMIGQFYQGFREGEGKQWPDFVSVAADYAKATLSAQMIPDPQQREMILATCIMVGFADGVMTESELVALGRMAASLELSPERFAQVLALVKDYMLMQLAGLPDTDSLIAVSRELG